MNVVVMGGMIGDAHGEARRFQSAAAQAADACGVGARRVKTGAYRRRGRLKRKPRRANASGFHPFHVWSHPVR